MKNFDEMINQPMNDTGAYVTYLENYLDCIESLPNDLQRHISRMREFDVAYQALIREVQNLIRECPVENNSTSDSSNSEEPKILKKIQGLLFSAQEFGDQKLEVVQQLQDLIETKTRLLDNDHRNIDSAILDSEIMDSIIHKESTTNAQTQLSRASSKDRTERANEREQRQSKRARRIRNEESESSSHQPEPQPSRHYYQGYSHGNHHPHHHEHTGNTPTPRITATLPITVKKPVNSSSAAKKKKRKSSKRDDSSNRDDDQSIDPDEPTYCLCDQISYGEMICCDNDLCPIEWFHFSCVSLSTKPKGKWFCPKCRGDRANVMKPKAQFLKELERYNKEKEEKSRNY